MRLNVAIPESHVAAPVLDAALEATTRLNESLLAADQIPTFERALKGGIRWRPEPPGGEHFDHGGIVMKRRWGDCDDLAPYHAASLRTSGEDPGAVAIVRRSGPKMWHAVVKRSDGSIDDPSVRAGMKGHHDYLGAVLPLMAPANRNAVIGGAYIVRPSIAVRPIKGGFQARADMPWHHWDADSKPSPTDIAMASLHSAPVAHTALTGAIEGAIETGLCAGYAHPEHVDRLMCLHGVLQGHSFRDLAEEFGEQEAHGCTQIIGSFFSHLNPMKALHTLTHPLDSLKSIMHNPLTDMAASFVPGGSAALHLANQFSNMVPGGGHGGGGGGGGARPPIFPGMNFHCTPFA